MTPVKICGLTTPETVEAALAGGAAFIGFMAFAASPRNIDPAAAGRLAARARGKAKVVAVTVDPGDGQDLDLLPIPVTRPTSHRTNSTTATIHSTCTAKPMPAKIRARTRRTRMIPILRIYPGAGGANADRWASDAAVGPVTWRADTAQCPEARRSTPCRRG